MWFINKIENAWYEIISPEKDELINDLENLKQNWNFLIFEDTIRKLNTKIEKSTNWKQRYFLEKQLEELKKIKDIYNESKNINITNNTKKEIENLINWLEWQISLQNNNIGDDKEKIKTILNNEKTRLNDNFDLFGIKNIRDRVESSIDIIWTIESIPFKEHQDFFDIFTTEYINFIEKRLNKKLEQAEEKYLIKNNWLFLDKYELDLFFKNFLNKNTNYNFDLEIKLEKNWTKEKVKVDIKKYIKLIKEEKTKKMKQNREIKEEKTEKIKQNREIKEKQKIKEMEEIFENNIEKFIVKERMSYIDNILNKEGFDIYYDEVLKFLENTTINLKNKKIKLTSEFIEDNKEKLIKNIKTLTSLIIEIESDWSQKAKNEDSSATWLWQWLIDDWKESKEYMYNRKWYANKLKWKEPTTTRTVRLTSSFETDLKSIKREFNNSEILEELDFIKDLDFNSKIPLTPNDLSFKQQIKILILRFIINNKENKNWAWYKVSKKDYLSTAIIWNTRWIKQLYKKFHHTNTKKDTDKRVEELIKKYHFEKID